VVVEKYLRRMAQRTRLLVSSGNHDGDGRNAAQESVCRWLQDVRGERLFVDGDSVDIDGTLVSICAWWDGNESKAEVERQLVRDAAREKKKWIWIYHSPPDGSPVSWTGRKSGGDEVLTAWIARFGPDAVLSGHIHNAPFYADGAWIDRLGKTWVLNPGRQIGPKPTYVVLDFDRMSARWFSLEEEVCKDLADATPAASAVGA
jgi:predicted phosphodiesterase